jgi:hypothetical protein
MEVDGKKISPYDALKWIKQTQIFYCGSNFYWQYKNFIRTDELANNNCF